MAEIFPFRAYRYDAAHVQLADVLTQPYDKITPQMQADYYARSPHNLIPIEKGRTEPSDSAGDNVYTRAAAALTRLISGGILVREPAPAIYAYFQDYVAPGESQRQTRRGFIALGRVHDYADGVVHRHEQTLSGPRADRLELLRHTRAHTGQLFMLYEDPQRRVEAVLDRTAGVPAPVEVPDEFGVTHRLWPIVDQDAIHAIEAAMADKKLVIADGHHRYETALAYRDEQRAALAAAGRPSSKNDPHEKVMMTFVNSHSDGLTILPTHRIVANLRDFNFKKFRATLAQWFDHREVKSLSDLVGAGLAPPSAGPSGGAAPRAIGAYAGGGKFHLFTLRDENALAAALPGVSEIQRRLDVVLLHRLILERGLGITAEAVRGEKNITYEREAPRAVAAVDEGRAQLCFLLRAVGVDRVMHAALAGEVLPQKSTDFYPKLLSGLAIYKLED